MPSTQEFADYVVAQMSRAGGIRRRMMFGEYAVYRQDKVIGLIIDNQLYVKLTPEGQALVPDAALLPPYQGAKPQMRIDDIEDEAVMIELARVTYESLPDPKPKTKRTKVAKP
ncbi:MAG: TfoX/Sxy family protein [Proteobacteria bacterium]|nr:TfoX/Sxy family protein [Pseudomonadota bacterium]